MTDSNVLSIAQHALTLAVAISAPILGAGLVVGLVVSIFQAATQIHEMTLTFIPKILAVAAALTACGPWMVREVVGVTTVLFQSIPTMVR